MKTHTLSFGFALVLLLSGCRTVERSALVRAGEAQPEPLQATGPTMLAPDAGTALGPPSSDGGMAEAAAAPSATALGPSSDGGTPEVAAAPSAKERSVAELYQEGATAYQAGQWDAADRAFRAVAKKEPGKVDAQFDVALVAHRKGDWAGAEQLYRQVLSLAPGHLPSLLNLGALLKEQGKLDEAIDLYEAALKLPGDGPKDALLNNLSSIYRLAKRFDKAEACAKQVLSHAPRNAQAHENLALISFDQGNDRLAELSAGQAKKLDETDPIPCNLLGLIHWKRGQTAEALVDFKEAIRRDGRFVPGHFNAGSIALSNRDYASAIQAFTQVVALDPKSYAGQINLAYALDGGRAADPSLGLKAAEAFEKALKLKPGQTEAICGAGWAYSTQEAGWDKAIDFLTQCRGLAGVDPKEQQRIDAKLKGLIAMRKAKKAPAQAQEAPASPASGGPEPSPSAARNLKMDHQGEGLSSR